MVRKTEPPLNTKQKRFAMLLASGETATAAYMKAYNSDNEKTSSASGCKLKKNPRVLQEIAKYSQENMRILQDTVQKEEKVLIMTRTQRQAFWTKVAMNPLENMNARLKATELLSRSEGDFIERREITDKRTVVIDDIPQE